MLTSRDATTLNDKMRTAFDKIGAEAPQAIKKNIERIAWDYYVARQMASAAEGRLKKATELAIEVGVLFDHKKDPRTPGDYVVFNGDAVDIQLKVKNPTESLQAKPFVAELRALAQNSKPLTVAVLDKLIAKHTKESAAAHQFTAALKTSDATPA